MTTKADAEVIAALAADDDAFEQLRDRAAKMVGSMMNQAERILEVGTPADKAQFVKTVLPAILKSLQEKKEGDDLAELRQAQADLMSEVREALLRPADGEEPGEEVAPVLDLPPEGERPRARRGDGGPTRQAGATSRSGDGKPTKVAPKGRARNSR